MAQPLTAEQAYRAAIQDVRAARMDALNEALRFEHAHRDVDKLFTAALTRRWQARIDAGELPPLLEKAS